jgi:hypothetical protein
MASFTALDGRVQLKVNRYKSDATNARAGDSGVIATRANRIDFGDDNFNLEDFAIGVLTARYQAQGVTPTPAQMKTEVAKFMGLPEDFIENVSGKSISETSDITSTGLEIELHVNPTRHWTMKFTGAKQQTIDTRLSPNIQRYVDQRLPVWTTIKDDAGNSWWTDTRASSFLAGDVLAPYRIAIANQGKPRSQVREWRMNALTSYDFAGLGSERGWLRNLTLGGSLRWEDQAAIGFLGKAPEPDGVIRELDPNKPVHDKARSYVDAFARYRFRLYNGKVRGNVQVNVRNLFEDGRLQVVGVNPDGAPFLFRIIDPRQVFLTTTFEL